MKTHRLFAWVPALGLVATLGACGGEQPPPQCAVGRGDHAVRYTLKQGTGACALKTVDIVGAQAFRVPGANKPPTLVLKPAPLAQLAGQDPAHSVTATGDFTSEYPQEGICAVPSMSEARQVGTAGGAAVDRTYRWSNLIIQGAAAIPGTQWTADLEYAEAGCTATYTAVGMFPAVRCVRANADGSMTRDPAICKQPRPGLSSIDPAFPVVCEESSNLCVLDGQPPVLIPSP